jgi:hypothetical protein
MMKAFYTCGYLFDVLTMFGNLDENIQVSHSEMDRCWNN